jgi:hypothetical protein
MVPVKRRCPAKCTAQSRADAILRQRARGLGSVADTAPVAGVVAEQVPVAAGRQESAKVPAAGRKSAAGRRPGRTLVPVVMVDAADGELVSDDAAVPVPAGVRTLAGLFAWLGSGLPLGVARVHQDGKTWDAAVCLSAAAVALVKLPAKLPTGKAGERFAEKLGKAAAGAGLEIGKVGPGVKVYRRRGEAGAKVSLSLVVVPWLGQGDARQVNAVGMMTDLARGADGAPDAATLARRLRAFIATVGISPGATPATTSMMLLEAVRPREQWSDAAGHSVLKEGALPSGDCAVPPAAGGRHALTRAEAAAGRRVCEEEDYAMWARELTEAEAAEPFAVAVDVCASFLSVTETLRLPAGPLELVESPVWDAKVAGLWWCDFTAVVVDELLPHPSEWHGEAPEGPGWYATPTVAYMATTYGFDTATITRAYLSTHTVAFLGEWTVRIRDAYKGAMATLGLVDGMDPAAFLAAHAVHKDTGSDTERMDALVLSGAYKDLYKKGIGKWAETGVAAFPDREEWQEKVPSRWSYRPEVRFTILAAVRVGAHRRMRKTYGLTGRAPFAVTHDAYMYACPEPSPLPLLPAPLADGRPVPGALRLGTAPGAFKHEASIPMDAVRAALADRIHPSTLKDTYTLAGTPAGEEN